MSQNPMRRISAKRAEQITERRRLTQIQAEKIPFCEGNLEGCKRHIHDVHELINRSQRSTAWLEPTLFISLCRPCHHFVTVHPLWAKKHGYTLSSWQYAPFNIEKAQRIRGKCRDKTCTKDHMELLSGD